MGNVLFTNVRIIDGSGAAPFAGEVLVQGNRIVRVGRGARSLQAPDATVIDAAGATLMPGMCEAHTHFSWNDAATLAEIQRMPLEEHVLWSANVAKRYLEAGFTSCVGAACAKARLDVVTRNAINEGLIPGPRYLAASQEITVAGGLGDETLPHLPWQEFSFGIIVSGPEEMRKLGAHVPQVRRRLDQAQPVGRQLRARRARRHDVDERRGGRGRGVGSAHARQARDVACALVRVDQAERAPRHRGHLPRELHRRGGARHARGAQGPPLRRARHRHPVRDAERSRGVRRHAREGRSTMGYQIEWDAALESLAKMHKRGIRVLPGGDYGFAMTPHCQNARDLEFFVKYLGMTPMEAIVSATKYGGQIMMRGHELGEVKEGYLADLLLVDGDPLANLAILREPSRMLAVMKDGVFYKSPEIRSARCALRPERHAAA